MTGSPFAAITQSVYREISHKKKVLDNSTYQRELGEFPHNGLELLHVSSHQQRIILKLLAMITFKGRRRRPNLLQQAITQLLHLLSIWRDTCCLTRMKQSSNWKNLRTIVRRNDGVTPRPRA
jgi:hypothetical protein